MEQMELVVETRAHKGSNAARRLRRQNMIPAVLYGANQVSRSLQISFREFDKLRKAHKSEHAVIDLQVKDLKKKVNAIMKHVEHDSIRGTPVHIDFMAITMDKKITSKVELKAVGNCVGVTEGGVLDHVLWELEVRALPRDLPEILEVDVSQLKMGAALHVYELSLPAGIDVLHDRDQVVFSVAQPRGEKEESVGEEEEAAMPEVITAKKDDEAEKAS